MVYVLKFVVEKCIFDEIRQFFVSPVKLQNGACRSVVASSRYIHTYIQRYIQTYKLFYFIIKILTAPHRCVECLRRLRTPLFKNPL